MSEPITGMSKSSEFIHSSRPELFWPHGLPLFSRFLNRPASSVGNSDSMSTW